MTTKELLVELRKLGLETYPNGDYISIGEPVGDGLNFYDFVRIDRKKMYDLKILADVKKLTPNRYKKLMQVLVEYLATDWEEREIDKERWLCTHENRTRSELIAKGTVLVFIEEIMDEVYLESVRYGRVRVPKEQFSVCYKRMD